MTCRRAIRDWLAAWVRRHVVDYGPPSPSRLDDLDHASPDGDISITDRNLRDHG